MIAGFKTIGGAGSFTVSNILLFSLLKLGWRNLVFAFKYFCKIICICESQVIGCIAPLSIPIIGSVLQRLITLQFCAATV